MKQTITFIAFAAILISAKLTASNVVTFTSSKDNTIIESTDGSKANSMNLIYVGNIAQSPSIRRGLIAFDVSSLPTNISIDSVKLVLTLSSSSANTLEVHKVTSAWGEGSANATGGAGVAATTNDVTWLHSAYNTTFWNTAGGDFENTVASTSAIAAGATSVTFRGSALLNHVQTWVTNSSTNYGWLLKSNDESTASGKIEKIHSKETGTDAQKPTLYIYYSSATQIGNVTQTTSLSLIQNNKMLEIQSGDAVRQVQIFSLSGKIVLSTSTKNLNLSQFPCGTYIVKVTTNQSTLTKKIIIY